MNDVPLNELLHYLLLALFRNFALEQFQRLMETNGWPSHVLAYTGSVSSHDLLSLALAKGLANLRVLSPREPWFSGRLPSA